MNTTTGAVTLLEAHDTQTYVDQLPAGHVLIQGAEEDIQRVSRTVSARYRAERKARNKAARRSRLNNR